MPEINTYGDEEKLKQPEKDELLAQICRWKNDSSDLRSSYDYRVAKNLKLVRGIFGENENTASKVRNRSKLYFRKIWATNWRFIAALYNAFMREKDAFRVEGRGPEDVQKKAEVLQLMVEYRRDLMMRKTSLFIKMIWGFMDIVECGWGNGKFRWLYKEDSDGNVIEDGPDYVSYPPEQVFHDMTAEVESDRKYVIFENYMSKEDVEALNGEGVTDDFEPSAIPYNQIRAVRYSNNPDPLQNPGEKEYAAPGRYYEGEARPIAAKYIVNEVFYRKDGKIKFCVTLDDKKFLLKPVDSAYGDDFFPDVHGLCLTVAHRLLGEGFPEPQEGPQESLNSTINARKDNIALSLNKPSIVDRFANVDIVSLTNSRVGGVVQADHVNAVQQLKIDDVTQSAYAEAAIDEAMMQEISGITPPKMGMERAEKATVAQINITESNAKIDFYLALVGETFIRQFYYKLAYYIQRFETDDKIFRVANMTLMRKNNGVNPAVISVDDFEADVSVVVGAGAVSTDLEIRNLMLLMDKGIMSNQATSQLMQMGLQPPQGFILFNTTQFMIPMLQKMGRRDIEKYFIKVPPLPPQTPGTNSGNGKAAMMGAMTPQMGDINLGQS